MRRLLITFVEDLMMGFSRGLEMMIFGLIPAPQRVLRLQHRIATIHARQKTGLFSISY